MGKRVSAKDFIDDEADVRSCDTSACESPRASDNEFIDDSGVHADLVNAREKEEEAEGIKELILQRDLLFQWHIMRAPVPNPVVRVVEWVGLEGNRKLVNMNTPYGEMMLPIANEHLMPGVLANSAFQNPELKEQSASQCHKVLRAAVRAGRKRVSSSAPRAKRAKPRTKKAKKAAGSSTSDA